MTQAACASERNVEMTMMNQVMHEDQPEEYDHKPLPKRSTMTREEAYFGRRKEFRVANESRRKHSASGVRKQLDAQK